MSMFSYRIAFPAAMIFLLSMTQCSQGSSLTERKNADTVPVLRDTIPIKEIAGNFSDQRELRFDSSAIDRFILSHPEFSTFKDDYQRFYAGRNYTYAWHNMNGRIEQTSILYNHVMQLRDNGISSPAPYVEEYTKMMEDESQGLSVEDELMFTGQYLFFAGKVLAGIPESDVKQLAWYVPRKKMDQAALLDSLLKGKAEPGNLLLPQYYQLQKELKRLMDIEKNGTWVSIKPDRKKYEKGDSSSMVREIRKKLFLAGDMPEDNGSAIFDDAMVTGIKEYQRRFGLKEDGVAGPSVLREMASTLSNRIRQVAVNMERFRWLPNETSDNIIVVNIPEFRLHIYEKSKLAWSSNVVVGSETNKTVIFKGDMKYVVLSPYWNVPPSIIQKEVKPGMARNKNYLASHNMEWNNGNVRQKPGPNNSLGLVKFLFPNSYNIYLHDTPSKSLFREDKRAFSHGCIRVSEPRRLAEYLLRNDPSWPKEKIWEGMNSGKEQFITLKPTIPVYIVYFTAFVDQNGKLNFRDDVYKRDEKLASMLFSATKPVKKD